MKKVLSGCLDFRSVERKQWRGCDYGFQRAVESTLQVTKCVIVALMLRETVINDVVPNDYVLFAC